MRYLAAVVLAIPTSVLLLFGITFQISALSGKDATDSVAALIGVSLFVFATAFALYRAPTPADVVQRGCRLGMIAAVVLPALVLAAVPMWEDVGAPGMGGMLLYLAPVMAFGLGLVCFAVYFAGSRLARRRVTVRRPE